MATNSTNDKTFDHQSPSEVQLYFDYNVVVFFMFLTSVCGVLGNSVNCVTFTRQGLQDRVQLTLFSLSTSELFSCVFCVGYTIAIVCKILEVPTYIGYEVISYILIVLRCIFTDISSAITVFISIERCLCVTLPFIFNTKSTPKTTKIILTTLTVFVVINYVPLLCTENITPYTDHENNVTILSFGPSEGFEILNMYNDYLFGFTLSFLCQICVFVCAILMYRGLKKSSEVRDNSKEFGQLSKEKESNLTGSPLSRKERRVVKMVLMLACLYIPTGIPQIIFVLVRIIFPELYSTTYINLFEFMTCLLIVLSTINGACSFFIYFHFSTNFRLALLGEKSDKVETRNTK
ncbi:uncharacterized protein LOC131946354 [Physella acuta]|uniref:uncharacterized protein LOC131946354 n=1 Tax=Physella acuta TaxID=109671 RepID=UPI0027DC3B68|nr:uncharacterized protein LOC131946354 [Physella acuta]